MASVLARIGWGWQTGQGNAVRLQGRFQRVEGARAGFAQYQRMHQGGRQRQRRGGWFRRRGHPYSYQLIE